ncbi:hypothetical protein [Algoriphagus boritolerans]|nr:hypothetical protein [Algoriphagus boritolerans]
MKPLLFLFLFISFSNLSLGQDRKSLNVSIGIGPNESSDIGLRFQKNQMQYGIGIGTVFAQRRGTNRPEIFTGEFFYHFAGKAELSTRKPWYLRNGLVLYKDETSSLRTLTWLFNSRIGRDFNVSKRIGISLDAGIITRIRSRSKEIGPNPQYNDEIVFPIFPSAGLSLWYRIY